MDGSKNFVTTHEIVKDLLDVNDWTDDEIDMLLDIALNNHPVRYLLNDIDVKLFYRKIIGTLRTKTEKAVAMLCLENLHIFLDFVAYCYADEYTETKFDAALVPTGVPAAPAPAIPDVDLTALIEENKKLKEQLQDAPFTDNGSIVEVFTDLTLWIGIKRVIDKINANALAA